MKKIKALEKKLEKEINDFLFSISLLTSAKGVGLKITNKVTEVFYTYGEFTEERDSFTIETKPEGDLKCILFLKNAKELDTYRLFHLKSSLNLLKQFFIREIQFILRKTWQEIGFSINILQFEIEDFAYILKTATEFLLLLFDIEVEGMVFFDEHENFYYTRHNKNKFLFKNIAIYIKNFLIENRKITFFEVIHNYQVYAKFQHPYFLAIFFKKNLSPIYFLVISFLANELFWLLTHLKLQKIERLSYEDLIKTLIASIEAKDIYTYGHSEGVTFYALKIGEALELSREKLTTLKEAAFLHDVGKIGIPDNILLKPGRLTKSEFEIIKLHTVIGAEILKRAKRLAHLAPIVRAHHEKWNGTGYPDRLAKDQIPFLARIIAIADVFDALTHERIYREAFPKEKALEILEEESGKSFDPNILKVAISVLTEIPIFKPEKEELISTQMEFIRANFFYKDTLTGSYNINAFYALAKEIEAKVQIIFVCLKEFYYLNLIKGPFETDKIILNLYQELAENFGEENIYKVGPDEFIILVFHPLSKKNIKEIFKKIESKISASLSIDILETEYSLQTVETILNHFKVKKNYLFLLHNNFLILQKVCNKVIIFDRDLNVLYQQGVSEKEIEKIKQKKELILPINYLNQVIGYFFCGSHSFHL